MSVPAARAVPSRPPIPPHSRSGGPFDWVWGLPIDSNQRLKRSVEGLGLGAVATGAGAWFGARLLQGQGDIPALAAAIACAGLGYGAVLLSMRGSLPLGRRA